MDNCPWCGERYGTGGLAGHQCQRPYRSYGWATGTVAAVDPWVALAALRAQLEAMTAERDKWQALVLAHNSYMENACLAWQAGGYCSAPGRPHVCQDCPRGWCIDVPDPGKEEAK